MISDTLSEAAAEMRGDLQKAPDSYPPGEPLTARIVALIAEMDAVQREIEAHAAADLAAVDRRYQLDEIGNRQPPACGKTANRRPRTTGPSPPSRTMPDGTRPRTAGRPASGGGAVSASRTGMRLAEISSYTGARPFNRPQAGDH